MSDGNFDFLNTVKILMRKKNSDEDELLNLYIEITKQEILNYCNIDELPSELNFVLCTMVVDCYYDNKLRNDSGEVTGSVTSISEGDRTVDFSDGSSFKTSVENKILKTTELNRFKKLYKL